MAERISVLIPNYNGGGTIGRCLEAVFASRHNDFEVIVVDDCSDDDSLEIIGRFPCKLIRFTARSGASKARNEGARQAKGEILFFIDADCIVAADTLSMVEKAMAGAERTVYGGTYTPIPYDKDFFSLFQSVFINYSETRNEEPDYIASHAMAIRRDLFLEHKGFPEEFLPIIEDVEFSHRMRKAGVRLLMDPGIMVTHIFNFSFMKSVRNAFRKSRYWTVYSIINRDLASDSGTASVGLKFNVLSWAMLMIMTASIVLVSSPLPAAAAAFIMAVNLMVNMGLMEAMHKTGGISLSLPAALYYMFIYPVPVGAGGLAGLLSYLLGQRTKRV